MMEDEQVHHEALEQVHELQHQLQEVLEGQYPPHDPESHQNWTHLLCSRVVELPALVALRIANEGTLLHMRTKTISLILLCAHMQYNPRHEGERHQVSFQSTIGREWHSLLHL